MDGGWSRAFELYLEAPEGLIWSDCNPIPGLRYLVCEGLGTSYLHGSDIAAPGDYDGDGRTDFAAFRPADGTWYIRRNSGGELYVPFGLQGDVPIPGVNLTR